MSPEPGSGVPRPPRRKRYAGKNPRRFEDKYKEHGADPETLAKVTASGKTPAGTHIPILLPEILEVLRIRPGETAADLTLGYGGHAAAFLQAVQPGGRLIALDADPLELPRTESRLRALGFPENSLRIHRSNFAGLRRMLDAENLAGVDALLADLGVSSMQIDNPGRGFSYKTDGPLDMRLNPARGQSAAGLLASITPGKLAILLEENADEPQAQLLAEALAGRRFETTLALAGAIRSLLPVLSPMRPPGASATAALPENPARTGSPPRPASSPFRRAPESVSDPEATLRRVFQALRIAVNEEFTALDTLLRQLPACLNPGGRAAFLTFHSGEDRRVKKAFAAGLADGTWSAISETVLRAGPDERRSNPRSTSAKLRWAVRA